MKLVDARDSKSRGPCAHESSILSSGTSKIKGLTDLVNPFFGAEIRDCNRFCCEPVGRLHSRRYIVINNMDTGRSCRACIAYNSLN